MWLCRAALESDVPAISAIYNEAIVNTTATLDTEVKSIENRLQWFKQREADFIISVAEINNEVIAYAAVNPWSERKAYNITGECSMYVLPAWQGKGIGSSLLNHLLNRAENTGLVSLIARITAGNEHSLHLHQKAGFQNVGVLKKAGNKFNNLLDVYILQKMLK